MFTVQSQSGTNRVKVKMLDFLFFKKKLPPLEILLERRALSRPGLRVKAFLSARWINTVKYKLDLYFQSKQY